MLFLRNDTLEYKYKVRMKPLVIEMLTEENKEEGLDTPSCN